LVVIAGPTASGKSALALQLAEALGGQILVADSRQVYRGMDVGAAKATAAERACIPHHGLDLVEPERGFDAAKFVEFARERIGELSAHGVPLVVEGGTGLYLRALVMGLMEAPPRDEAVRARIRQEAALKGWPALHQALAAKDPGYAARIERTDPVRITRALEVLELTGRPFSAFTDEHAFKERPYDVNGYMVDVDRQVLRQRIEQRVRRMWMGGLLEETGALMARITPEHPLMGTINYAQAAEHLQGRMTAEEAQEQMVLKTAQFSKRQRTWFKKEPWLKPIRAAELSHILDESRAFLGR